jgi:alpha-tubulin suppressor-like RCC1 family protein
MASRVSSFAARQLARSTRLISGTKNFSQAFKRQMSQISTKKPSKKIAFAGVSTIGTIGFSAWLFGSSASKDEEDSPKTLAQATYTATPKFTTPLQKDTLYGWGANNLLLESSENNMQFSPVQLKNIETKLKQKFESIALGKTIAVGIGRDKKLYIWGNNTEPQLVSKNQFNQVSIGSNDLVAVVDKHGAAHIFDVASKQFVQIGGEVSKKKIAQVASGANHVALLTTDGLVYTYGNNTLGQLGTGDTKTVTTSVQVAAFKPTDPVVSLACGSNHTVAVTRKGKVYSFGDNKSMQCGHEIKTESIKLDNSDMSSGEPEKITHFEKKRIKVDKALCGDNFTYLIGRSGSLYAFGNSQYGQICDGQPKHVTTPREIKKVPFGENGAQNIKSFSCGSKHCAALMKNGELWSWGWNNVGQCGTGDRAMTMTPRLVLNDANIKQVSCGGDTTVVLT